MKLKSQNLMQISQNLTHPLNPPPQGRGRVLAKSPQGRGRVIEKAPPLAGGVWGGVFSTKENVGLDSADFVRFAESLRFFASLRMTSDSQNLAQNLKS
ncbi:hypothetical protein [Helicobacter sp. 23-1045]